MTHSINIRLKCSNFPGLAFEDKHPISVGVQRKNEVVDAVPGDTGLATFSIPVKIKEGRDGRPDFLGPNVHGKVGDRFLYLVWFENKGKQERFRRAKVKLSHLTWQQVQSDIETEVTMTDHRGGPVCATIPADLIKWQFTSD